MKEQEDAIWAKILEKRAETKLLETELFNLRKVDDENFLRTTYLGKCYIRKKKHVTTYLYVNSIDDSNRLNCIEFIIMNFEEEKHYSISIDSIRDFSCHYLQNYNNDATISECEEITRDEFNLRYIEALQYYENLIK